MTLLTPICDAVVADLNGATWSPTFTAVRQNVPRVRREELSSLSVIVTPNSRDANAITRARSQVILEVYVLLQKGLTSDSNDETDPLIALGESIAVRYQQGKSLTVGGAVARCTGAKFGVDDDTAFLAVASQNEALKYMGAVLLTFMVHE